MKSHRTIGLAGAALFLAITGTTSLRAEEPAINPTGAWKVIVVTTNTQVRPDAQTLKLKLDGSTLTGTLSYNSSPTVNGKARISELPITEAKLQGSEISFHYTHPPSFGTGPGANYRYQGTIRGDSIKGTFTEEWRGHTFNRNWEAQRLKE
jgi:hypothetical protein